MRTWLCNKHAEHVFYTCWPDALGDRAHCPWCKAAAFPVSGGPVTARPSATLAVTQSSPHTITAQVSV